jgi:hypothetical protein
MECVDCLLLGGNPVMKKAILVITLLILVSPVFCCPTGLTLIPTADVLSQGGVFFCTERCGTLSTSVSDAESNSYFQVGLGYGLEMGYDVYADNSHAWNAKWALPTPVGGVSLALGVMGITKGETSQTYIMGTKPFGVDRVHLGMVNDGESFLPMLGYDRQITDRIKLELDYIGGDDNCASLGFWIDINKTTGINLAYTHQNSGPDRGGFSLIMGWSFGG